MSLFIGNITEAASKDDLIQEFSKFGRCKVEYFKKFAFCNYNHKVDAAEAMKYWNARNFKGNILKVEFSQRKNDNQSSGTPSPEPKTSFEAIKKKKKSKIIKNPETTLSL